MKNRKIVVEFTTLTFFIAFIVATTLIVFSQFGYTVYNWVDSLPQFIMNIPFAIYILSPAIASYIVLKRNHEIASFQEWLKTVFYVKNNILLYLYVFGVLAIYFFIHFMVFKDNELALPFYTFFLALPGNLIIGGLEETGWVYVLQSKLDKKYGYIIASLLVGIIWLLWHIPLFFISGTNHSEGLINFGMFSIQVMAFRFMYGAIYKISMKGGIFLCVLFHSMFNALSPIFNTTTWAGTIIANTIIILISLVTVEIYNKKNKQIIY